MINKIGNTHCDPKILHHSIMPSPLNPTQKTSKSHRTSLLTLVGAWSLFFVIWSGTGALSPATTTPTFVQAVSHSNIVFNQDSPTDSSSSASGIVECTITLTSGRQITGELISQDDQTVVIGMNGIETTFQKNRILKLKVLPPVEERYKTLRESTPDNDIDTRLSLVEWLRERKAYTLALQELESILLIEPNNPRAKLLFVWLDEYLGLQKTSKSDDQQPNDQTTKNKDPNTKRSIPQTNDIPKMTKEQIQLARVYELDLKDPPKLVVPDETMRTLIKRFPDSFSPNERDHERLYKLPEIDKLRLIFTHKARDLYDQVKVLEDPTSMNMFKEQVHSQRGWVINACASTRCHGGNQAGRFQLINTKPNSAETIYTNFMIIENYRMADGSSLINYDAPDRSPLLQMGMIRSNAITPHPEMPESHRGATYRPIFRSTRSKKYQNAIDWIRSMYQPRPDYEKIFEGKPWESDSPEPDPTVNQLKKEQDPESTKNQTKP